MRLDQALVYPHTLVSLLLPILDVADCPYERIVFTGNHKAIGHLNRRFPERPSKVHFVHLPHESFVSLVRSSRHVLTSPGLTTTYEAFLLNVPVRFLPPQNYSQTLMLDYYRQAGLSDVSLHWRDLYPAYDVGHGLEVSTAVRTILSTVNTFAQDPQAQDRATHILRRVMNEPVNPTLCLRQAKFARSMGRPAPEIIARRIDDYLTPNPTETAAIQGRKATSDSTKRRSPAGEPGLRDQ